MQILNYFLFICFINLCNSFILINQKYFHNFISHYYKNKLNMGCDYYVDKDLDMYDNDIIFSSINLEHKKGYYLFIHLLDKDEEGYDEEFSEYIEEILEPNMKPIVIYSNNTFNKLSFENKYKKIIEDELNVFNKTWNDLSKIIKKEHRYKKY